MAFLEDLAKGGAEGLMGGLGKMARDLRAAITGKEALSAEDVGKLALQAAELEKAVLFADVEITKAQLEINKAEASSASLFKGGWRPFAGWGAAFAVVAYPIIRSLLPWFIQVGALILGKDPSGIPALPALDTTETGALLFSLLGIGGFRTFERVRGKA